MRPAASWRLIASANGEYERSESDSDRSVVTAFTDDESKSTRTSLGLDVTANGPVLKLPAGNASATIKGGLTRLDFDSEARRRDMASETDLGRTVGEGSVNLDVPLTAPRQRDWTALRQRQWRRHPVQRFRAPDQRSAAGSHGRRPGD